MRFVFVFGFLSWYHLPCIRDSLELEPVILHGICYIFGTPTSQFVWYLLHVGTSNVHDLSFCMVFATCWYSKRSSGFLFGVSLRFL